MLRCIMKSRPQSLLLTSFLSRKSRSPDHVADKIVVKLTKKIIFLNKINVRDDGMLFVKENIIKLMAAYGII